MTRKRFVKLLMAQGMQRNEANEKAQIVQEIKVSYSEAFIAWSCDRLKIDFGAVFAAAVEKLKETIIEGIEAIRDFAKALNEKAGE